MADYLVKAAGATLQDRAEAKVAPAPSSAAMPSVRVTTRIRRGCPPWNRRMRRRTAHPAAAPSAIAPSAGGSGEVADAWLYDTETPTAIVTGRPKPAPAYQMPGEK